MGSNGRTAARIPDTPERKRLEKQRGIREIVFGAQDGLLTTLGIVTGVGSASNDRATILITGGLSLLVGALSMGVGEYLGGKSEREVVQSSIDFEQREMLDMPEEEFAEQVAYYRLKGFTDEEALMIVERLKKNPEIWLHEMVRDEFGIDLREAEAGSLRSTFAMAGLVCARRRDPDPAVRVRYSARRGDVGRAAAGRRRALRHRRLRGAALQAQSLFEGLRDRVFRRARVRRGLGCGPIHPAALRTRRDQRRRLTRTGATDRGRARCIRV